uniref:Uncharacterized protein n=1 Tax=viral metagenome TaxID=1070528 RepID=A0A6C0EL49_9ZZZZ
MSSKNISSINISSINISSINISSVSNSLDFILNDNIPIIDEYRIKFKKNDDNFERNFNKNLKNYYTNNNIYNSLRYKKTIESWMLDIILILERQNILKKCIFELS